MNLDFVRWNKKYLCTTSQMRAIENNVKQKKPFNLHKIQGHFLAPKLNIVDIFWSF